MQRLNKRALTATVIVATVVFAACGAPPNAPAVTPSEEEATAPSAVKPAPVEGPVVEKITKTDAEWRAILTPEQYRVTRRQGTETACTSPLLTVKESGTFYCVCCGLDLFHSNVKFESGTGWPSFYEPIEGHVDQRADDSHGMHRTEVLCARCDAHLGHVFGDGPPPTGQRYCINGIALDFVAEK
jgi:peptide-methionine (R)-S-oxide reductase